VTEIAAGRTIPGQRDQTGVSSRSLPPGSVRCASTTIVER
jgi:hypothetical protein